MEHLGPELLDVAIDLLQPGRVALERLHALLREA